MSVALECGQQIAMCHAGRVLRAACGAARCKVRHGTTLCCWGRPSSWTRRLHQFQAMRGSVMATWRDLRSYWFILVGKVQRVRRKEHDTHSSM